MAAIAHKMAPIRTGGIRRTGWFLIAAFAAGILIIIMQIVFYAALDAQLVSRAAELGQRPPLEEYARIQAQHAKGLLVETATSLVLGPLPFVLLAGAMFRMHHALHGSATQRLPTLAWWCALGALVAWLVQLYLDWGVKFGPERLPPLVALFDHLYSPLAFATAWLGLAAMICAALALRKTGIAPRMALATVIIAVLLVVINAALALGTGFSTGLPPIVPLIPALSLGVGLARAKRT